jgi:hypothetical protein
MIYSEKINFKYDKISTRRFLYDGDVSCYGYYEVLDTSVPDHTFFISYSIFNIIRPDYFYSSHINKKNNNSESFFGVPKISKNENTSITTAAIFKISNEDLFYNRLSGEFDVRRIFESENISRKYDVFTIKLNKYSEQLLLPSADAKYDKKNILPTRYPYYKPDDPIENISEFLRGSF